MLVFWVGTVAELIKMFTVIEEAKNRGIPFKIIATGQNELKGTDVLKACNDNNVDVLLSDPSCIKKSACGLLSWFRKTYLSSIKTMKALQKEWGSQKNIMVVHGDTVSTLMGAKVAKKCGFKIAHIEAGLRSFDLFHPFPEEIDRILTSKKVSYHFCPGKEACENLLKVGGEKINTVHNTIVDGLNYSKKVTADPSIKKILENHPDFFVFVIHRQENIANKEFFSTAVKKVIEKSKTMHCVFILHEITKIALENSNLLDSVKTENFTLLNRTEYFDFMKILTASQFVITDGGSNQEELAYMGKPCLIMRTATERKDGIGENAVLCNNDFSIFDNFIGNYKEFQRSAVIVPKSPTKIITDKLQEVMN